MTVTISGDRISLIKMVCVCFSTIIVSLSPTFNSYDSLAFDAPAAAPPPGTAAEGGADGAGAG